MYIIDRFEGDWAVIETGAKTFRLPRELLPPEAKEGDALRFAVAVDKGQTKERQAKIKALAAELFEQ